MPWNQKIADDFNRANEDPLASPWVKAYLCDNVRLYTNRLELTAGGTGTWYHSGYTAPDDQYAQIKMLTTPSGTGVGPAVRIASGSTQSFMIMLNNNPAGGLLAYKCVAGTWTQLGATISCTWAGDDVARFESTGSNHEFFRNGSSLGTRSDSSLTSGYTGFYIGTPYTHTGDDWSAGESVSAEEGTAAWTLYGGVSTLYTATQIDAVAPSVESGVASDYSYESSPIQNISLDGDAWVAASSNSVLFGDAFPSTDVWSVVAAGSTVFSDAYPEPDVWADITTGTTLFREVYVPISADLEVGTSASLAFATVLQGDASEAFDADSVKSFAPAISTNDVSDTLQAGADLSLAIVKEADTGYTLYAGSDIIQARVNLVEGTVAWTLTGGVSTLYCATQQDAGVPIHSFVAGSDYTAELSILAVLHDGAVVSAFSVGDDVTAGTDVIILPVLDGLVEAYLLYASVLDIYATPAYTAYQISGDVFWRVAEPVSEFWIDTAWDRVTPMHNFEAWAVYTSNSTQVISHAGLADCVFVAGADPFRGRQPVPSVYEVFAAAADYSSNLFQTITETGATAAVFTAEDVYPIRAFVTDGTADAVFSASCVEVPPYPTRTIVLDGDVTGVFALGTSSVLDQPEAVLYEGNVVFFADTLAEKAVSNLHDSLAAYASLSSAALVYAPWSYADNYEQEAKPYETHVEEFAPAGVDTANEPVPTIPDVDGAWTIPDQDGAVTEPYKDGAYAGYYFKEFKPWWQAYTQEAVPGHNVAVRGAWTDENVRGAWTETDTRGALASISGPGYIKERKPT